MVKVTTKRRNKAIRLIGAGLSLRAIGISVGLSHEAVRKIKKEAEDKGITFLDRK